MVNYNLYAETFANSRKNMKWEEISYFLNGLELTGKKILDIGCGSGRFYRELKNKGSFFDYTGIDLSKELINIANKDNKGINFIELDMLNIDKLETKFDYIFFIASYHHLSKYSDRKLVLSKIKNLLNENGKVYMTNWALESQLNLNKYAKQKIGESCFGSGDFNIKIGSSKRYYHSFSLEELNTLFLENGFYIIENRIFDNDKNFISILKKI